MTIDYVTSTPSRSPQVRMFNIDKNWSMVLEPVRVPVPRRAITVAWKVRLECGLLFRGPAVHLGLTWWVRPTFASAVRKGQFEMDRTMTW